MEPKLADGGQARIKEMRRVSGTPAEFAEAVDRAADQLWITTEEAEAAKEKYRREWEEAARSK